MGMFGWLAKEVLGEKHVGKCAKCHAEMYADMMSAPKLHHRDCCNIQLCNNCHFTLNDQYGGSPKEFCPCCHRKTGGEVAEFWEMVRKHPNG